MTRQAGLGLLSMLQITPEEQEYFFPNSSSKVPELLSNGLACGTWPALTQSLRPLKLMVYWPSLSPESIPGVRFRVESATTESQRQRGWKISQRKLDCCYQKWGDDYRVNYITVKKCRYSVKISASFLHARVFSRNMSFHLSFKGLAPKIVSPIPQYHPGSI